MKDELCKAFCDELVVRKVPAGLAIGTTFNWMGGEPLGFYIVGPDELGRYRIEDDGTTVPVIEAAVADLESHTRAEAFQAMLDEYHAIYDEERGELTTPAMPEDRVPQAAMKFVALLLRLQDIVLLTPERVASTFRDDALREIKTAIADRAVIREQESIAPMIEFPADIIVQAENRDPVAIFLAMSEQRVLEAVVAQMAALYEAHIPCSVIALLDKDTSVSRKLRQRAANRLSTVQIFQGDETAAVQRIVREVLGSELTVH